MSDRYKDLDLGDGPYKDAAKEFIEDVVKLAKMTITLAERQASQAEAIVSLIKRLNEIEARQFTKEHSNV